MPLHADEEACAGQRDRFDLPIGSDRLDEKSRCQPVDALAMQRIHLELVRAGQFFESAAGRQRDAMRAMPIALIDRLEFRPAVIEPAGQEMHVLI